MGIRVALVQRRLPGEKSLLYELRDLAESAGYEVVLEVEQIREPDSRYQIGYGKALELAELVRERGVEKVIFFNELKPVQVHNLSKLLGVEVVDRVELILEIFAKRAGSREAKLQIELARLRRELSVAKEKLHLAKLGELPGYMGGGEYIIDSYRAHVAQRIAKIEDELERIRRRKDKYWTRRIRSGVPTVVLTGYTGAGKTTLFNALTGEERLVDGKPFATLSTKSKRVKVDGKTIVLSDTIGFIDCLPPLLVEAFYTTLAEIAYASLVLLVVDISDPIEEVRRKVGASLDALRSVGITDSNLLPVLNKLDLVGERELGEKLEAISEILESREWVLVSAKRGLGLDGLRRTIAERLREYVVARAYVPLRHADRFPWGVGRGRVLRVECNGREMEVDIEVNRRELGRLEKLVGELGGRVVVRSSW